MGNTISTFSKFESLPKELHLQIWEEALDSIESAYVVIQRYHLWMDKNGSLTHPLRRHRASVPVPTLFQVNQEAREVALRKYRLMLADVNTPSKPLYFNPDKDSLHLCNPGLRVSDAVWEEITASSPRLQEDLALIKHLVAYTKSWAFDNGFPYRLIAYESLETLSIPGNMREHGVAAALYEEQVRAAMVEFWATEMNPRQVGKGKPTTHSPKLPS